MTTDERPEATRYFAEVEAADGWQAGNLRLTVRCAACRNRIGVVMRTERGPLWVGFLGAYRNGRRPRRAFHAEAGWNSDGRTPVPIWIDPPAPHHYMCDCECGRTAADGPTVRAALLAGRKAVDLPKPA